jgi:hypothetical protein
MTVDVNIVTGLDTSDSIGRHEQWIEREGLARALVHSRFLDAVRAGEHGRIGFSAFTWSSGGRSEALIPWTLISTRDDAERIAGRLLAIELIDEGQFSGGDHDDDHDGGPTDERLTDTAEAIRLGADHLRGAPFESRRRVMNIVGNGASNTGEQPAAARADALEQGYTINGLIIGNGGHRVIDHYRREVVGGPGSFLIELRDTASVTEAFVAKLRLDMALSMTGRERNLPPSHGMTTARYIAKLGEVATTGAVVLVGCSQFSRGSGDDRDPSRNSDFGKRRPQP